MAKKTFKRKIFLEGYLDNLNRNVRMPQLDKLYCRLDWIRASCLRQYRADTMTLVEGGVSSPHIVLHLGRGTMKPA